MDTIDFNDLGLLPRKDLLVKLFETAKELSYGARRYSEVDAELTALETEVDRFYGKGTCDRISFEATRTRANPDDLIDWAQNRWGELEEFLDA